MSGPGGYDERAISVIDSRDYALIITVDKRGYADLHADGVPREQAAEWLNILAAQFTESTTNTDGSFARREVEQLRRIVRALANHEPIAADLTDIYEMVVES